MCRPEIGPKHFDKFKPEPVPNPARPEKPCPTYKSALHRPIRFNFQRRRIVVKGIDNQWEADFTDLTKLKMFKNGHTFVLSDIAVFSKFA